MAVSPVLVGFLDVTGLPSAAAAVQVDGGRRDPGPGREDGSIERYDHRGRARSRGDAGEGGQERQPGDPGVYGHAAPPLPGEVAGDNEARSDQRGERDAGR